MCVVNEQGKQVAYIIADRSGVSSAAVHVLSPVKESQAMGRWHIDKSDCFRLIPYSL